MPRTAPTFLADAEKAIDLADLIAPAAVGKDYRKQVEQAEAAQLILARIAGTESERVVSKKVSMLIGEIVSCHSTAKDGKADLQNCQKASRTRYEVMSLLGVYKIGESWFVTYRIKDT